jgi:thiosulfate dehydrogenase [quinone] large subunit
MRVDNRALALALLRWTLGFNLVGHGLNRLGHLGEFAKGMANDFSHTFLPSAAVLAFGFVLPFFEPLVGVLLVTGLFTRVTLLAGGLSMVALSFGTALLGRWDILTQQLVYAVVYFLLISGLNSDMLRFASPATLPPVSQLPT